MKNKIVFTILFVLSITLLSAQTSWEQVSTIQEEWMNKVYTQGENNVYIAGEKGLIVKSTDKALTWNKQYFSTQVTLNDIVFCNEDVGFIVGNNGTILKTEDAGATWRQIIIESTENINAIAATSLNNIWVVGNGSLVIHSNDSGETWTAKNISSDNRNLKDIKFRESIGYITGQGGKILKTENAGATWEEQIAFDFLTEIESIYSLSLTENKVYAFANGHLDEDGFGVIILTEDNYNWSILDNTPQGSETGVYFQNDNLGFVAVFAITTCGDCSFGIFIFNTKDGRNTWEVVDSKFFHGGYPGKNNFSFSANNKFGYFVFGKWLLRTPYTGEFVVGLKEIESQAKMLVKQSGTDLNVSSPGKTISNMEIISVTGTIVEQKNGQSEEYIINIAGLQTGMYMVRATFFDNTNSVVKWVKK